MSYTIEQLLWSVRHGSVNVTAETAAFLVLSAAEQLRSGPRLVQARSICLVEAGSVVLGDTPAASGRECDEQLRLLLEQLLARCGGDHPTLLAVANGEARSPGALAEELFAALVPMNRSAARRALCRLHRRLDAAGIPAEPSPSPARTAIPKRLVEREGAEVELDAEELSDSDFVTVTPDMPTPLRVPNAAAGASEAQPLCSPFVAGEVHLVESPPTPRIQPSAASSHPLADGPPPPVAPRSVVTPTVDGPWLVSQTPVVAACQNRFRIARGEPTPYLGSVGVGPCEFAALAESVLELTDTPTVPIQVAAHGQSRRPDEDLAAGPHEPTPVATPSLAFGRFASRRSDLKCLVAGFSVETTAPRESVVAQLGRCIDDEVTARAYPQCTPLPSAAAAWPSRGALPRSGPARTARAFP